MTAPIDVHALAGELMQKASAVGTGRAASTLPHPVDGLHQTLIALTAGALLDEHESPGPASLMVIRGRVRMDAGDLSVEIGPHHIAPVPDERHSLRAEENAVVLLSVALPTHGSDPDDAPSRRRRNVGG